MGLEFWAYRLWLLDLGFWALRGHCCGLGWCVFVPPLQSSAEVKS